MFCMYELSEAPLEMVLCIIRILSIVNSQEGYTFYCFTTAMVLFDAFSPSTVAPRRSILRM